MIYETLFWSWLIGAIVAAFIVGVGVGEDNETLDENVWAIGAVLFWPLTVPFLIGCAVGERSRSP